MTPLVFFCIWVVVASAIGFGPRRFHWRGAIVLMISAVPLLASLYLEYGPWWTLLAFAAVMSILRWPALFLVRRLGRIIGTGVQR